VHNLPDSKLADCGISVPPDEIKEHWLFIQQYNNFELVRMLCGVGHGKPSFASLTKQTQRTR
jgi:hypothetical protein